jgi:hypothetical protein
MQQSPGEILAEGYLTYANPDASSSDGTAYDLGVLGVFQKSFGQMKKFSGSAKLGVAYASRDYDLDSGGSISGSGLGLAYGIGAGYDLNDKHGVQFEYLISTNPDLDGSGVAGTIDSNKTTDISIGYVMNF